MLEGTGNEDGLFESLCGIEYYNNQILVTDKNKVHFFTPDGEYLKSWDFENTPRYISVNEDELYISCESFIQKMDLSGKILAKIGLGVLERAYGIGFDAQGRVFVVDASLNNIKVFTIVE